MKSKYTNFNRLIKSVESKGLHQAAKKLKAIKYSSKEYKRKIDFNPTDNLLSSFVFSFTKEGHSYWKSIYISLIRKD